jgi:hypothetical protein
MCELVSRLASREHVFCDSAGFAVAKTATLSRRDEHLPVLRQSHHRHTADHQAPHEHTAVSPRLLRGDRGAGPPRRLLVRDTVHDRGTLRNDDRHRRRLWRSHARSAAHLERGLI